MHDYTGGSRLRSKPDFASAAVIQKIDLENYFYVEQMPDATWLTNLGSSGEPGKAK
jgi:hypothetical protein